MAAFQIEKGTYVGSGFGSGELLALFKAWVVKSPANGGPGWSMLDDQSSLGSDPYIVVSDIQNPSANEAHKVLRLTRSSSDTILLQAYLHWDSSSHVGYGWWAGYQNGSLQTAGAPRKYDFRGGPETIIINTQNSGGGWEDMTILDEWLGLVPLTEKEEITGELQSGVSAGSDVVLQLGTDEASNFTINRWYYIYDFDGHTWINYTKCTNVDEVNDRITVQQITENFSSGSVICAYAHRFYMTGRGAGSGSGRTFFKGVIPYVSSENQNNVMPPDDSITSGQKNRFLVDRVVIYNEHLSGTHLAQKPIIMEKWDYTGSTNYMNRAYGQCKNLMVTDVNDLVQETGGRLIDGDEWNWFLYTSSLFEEINWDGAALIFGASST